MAKVIIIIFNDQVLYFIKDDLYLGSEFLESFSKHIESIGRVHAKQYDRKVNAIKLFNRVVGESKSFKAKYKLLFEQQTVKRLKSSGSHIGEKSQDFETDTQGSSEVVQIDLQNSNVSVENNYDELNGANVNDSTYAPNEIQNNPQGSGEQVQIDHQDSSAQIVNCTKASNGRNVIDSNVLVESLGLCAQVEASNPKLGPSVTGEQISN